MNSLYVNTLSDGESALSTGVFLPLPVPPLAMPGRTGTAPGRDCFLLDGGTNCGGRVAGTASLAMPLWTRCIAYKKYSIGTSTGIGMPQQILSNC